MSLLVYHRTALAYDGEFTFTGAVRYRDDAFACRLTPAKGERVLSLKSGDADSLLNDALFSAAADEALRVKADNLALMSISPGVWEFGLAASITEPATCEISFEVVRDYYRIYFDKAGSKENLAEARLGKKYLQPFGLEFWSIESWQENSSELPVSKFYNMDLETHPQQFPEGMKWLADEIRKLGADLSRIHRATGRRPCGSARAARYSDAIGVRCRSSDRRSSRLRQGSAALSRG